MKCPSCGTNNKEGMKFCKICGASLETTNNKTRVENDFISKGEGVETQYTNEKKSGKGIVILIISIIVVLLAIGACVAFLIFGNSSKEEDNQNSEGTVATSLSETTSYNESATEETTEATVQTTVETISIPDVVGLSQTDAENKLDSVGLSVIVQEGEDDATPNGYVISQSPLAGKNVDKGESVTIYISKKETVPTTVSSNNSSSIDNKKYLYCCASDFATLRNKPSRSGSEIVKITTREKVEYLGRDGEFYYVSYKGDKGYVLSDFFSEDINAPLNYGTGNL